MGKSRNFLSFGSRLGGAFKAIIWALVVFLVVGIFSFAIELIPQSISLHLILVAIINVVYYLLINWFAAKGGIVGKIAFCLCLVIDIAYMAICFASEKEMLSFAAYAGVSLLLNMYVIDYMNWMDFLNGYSRHKYGMYASVVVGVISIILYLLLPDHGITVGIIVGIAVHICTVIAIVTGHFPFGREEVVSGSSSGNHSSSSTMSASSQSYSADRKSGGRDRLERQLRNYAPKALAYYLDASCDLECTPSVSYGRVSWTISIRGYNKGISESLSRNPGNEVPAQNFKSEVERRIEELKNECESVTKDAIEEIREHYEGIDEEISMSIQVNQIS